MNTVIQKFLNYFTIHNNDYDKQLFDSIIQTINDELKMISSTDYKYFRDHCYHKLLNSVNTHFKLSLINEIHYIDMYFNSKSKELIVNTCNIIFNDTQDEYQLFKSISTFDNYIKVCGKKKIEHPYIGQFNKLLRKYDAKYDVDHYFYDIQHIQQNKDAINDVISFINSLQITK